MKIALCQFDQVWEDRAANQRKISGMLAACPHISAAQWLVFPEMTLSGFSMSTSATTLTAADIAFFKTMARTNNLWVSFGGVVDGLNKLLLRRRCIVAMGVSSVDISLPCSIN